MSIGQSSEGVCSNRIPSPRYIEDGVELTKKKKDKTNQFTEEDMFYHM